ncbi:MAG: TIGR00282 family metallophosphoesterase [Eubacteriaceae bacterium]|nr:TIGR00282 family metallophosphoesterase [Eubacteriaceae bacterium]
MNILMFGDVVGRPGRAVLSEHLQEIKNEYKADIVIVNGENASGGNGLTLKNARQLLALPVDCVTMGNHVWRQKEILNYLNDYPCIVRPINYPDALPGKGTYTFEKTGMTITVLNASGQIFMEELDSPFGVIEKQLDTVLAGCDMLIVDFHAETTSEKLAMGYWLDGKATIVAGTHTHVQTADARLLPEGTAYITDLGMTGPAESVLGVQKEIIVSKMITKLPARFEIEKRYPRQINGICVTVDEVSHRPTKIERIYRIYDH